MTSEAFSNEASLNQLATNLRTHCQCTPEDQLLIGVSGGADSLALMLGCEALGQPIRAVHINHHLRDTSDCEAHQVRSICESHKIVIDVIDVDIANRPGNLERNARDARYAAMAAVAKKHAISKAAVAHHADDQFETCLMQLFRGCGPTTIGGMAWQRPIEEKNASDSPIQLIRPLLNVPRSACQAYCNARDVEWIEDPSNHDRNRTRSRLRHEVVPILEELFPNVRDRLPRSLARLDELMSVAMLQVDAVFSTGDHNSWSRQTLRDTPAAIVKVGLHRAASALLRNTGMADRLNAQHIEEAVAAINDDILAPRQYDWPARLKFHITSKVVTLIANDENN